MLNENILYFKNCNWKVPTGQRYGQITVAHACRNPPKTEMIFDRRPTIVIMIFTGGSLKLSHTFFQIFFFRSRS
jgi:hypothetical protein